MRGTSCSSEFRPRDWGYFNSMCVRCLGRMMAVLCAVGMFSEVKVSWWKRGGKRGRGAAAASSCIQHLVINVTAALLVLFVIAGRCFRMPCWVALNPAEYTCCFTWAQFCHAHRRARTTPRCSVVNFFFLALCYQPVSCCCCCNRSCRCRGVSL